MNAKTTMDDLFERAEEYHKFNWLEEAEKLYRAILIEMPDHPNAHYNLGDIAMKVGKPDVAVVCFEKALQVHPERERVQRVLTEARGIVQANVASDDPVDTPRIFELKGNDYVFDRRLNALENRLFLLNDKINSIHEALVALGVFETGRTDAVFSGVSPVEIVNKKATKTLIAFGGMALGLSMPPKEFFHSLVDKDLNIIFVKDFKQCWYQKGLLGITNDIESTVEYLKGILPKTTGKLITLGASAGGYAAIRFGVALNADRVLAFSPQTLIDKETVRVFAKNYLRDMAFDQIDLDLKKVIERYDSKAAIEVYYGSENRRDRMAVKHIKDHVKAIAYATDTHLLASYLKEKGLLQQIIASICDT
jgi:tetratricopeptide (TPR) repeat protein